MTTPFDPGDKMWKILVQPNDIITYIDDSIPGKRKIGQIGDVSSGYTSAGRMASYEIHGANFYEMEYINNYYDPQPATPELVAEFRAKRKVTDQKYG